MRHLGESTHDLEVEIRVEEIRKLMLDAMAGLRADHEERPSVWSRVFYVRDIQTLWYLRIDLMALLSQQFGEAVARDTLSAITERFRGVVPRNQISACRRICH